MRHTRHIMTLLLLSTALLLKAQSFTLSGKVSDDDGNLYLSGLHKGETFEIAKTVDGNTTTTSYTMTANGKLIAKRGDDVKRWNGDYITGEYDLARRELELILKSNPYNQDAIVLLRRVAAVEGLRRVRFLTSHPNWMGDELVETVASTEKLCPAFEVPVQSGSDAVLARMRRGYRADDFRALVERIRSRIPHASVSTDIIVGFCGETEKDFAETMQLVRDTQVDMIRIAKYSPRPLTYSARHLADDVPAEEKERRRVALDALLREMLTEKHTALAGTRGEILVERIEETEGRRHGRRRGRFPEGLLVFAENSTAQPGDILPVRITVPGPYASIAEAVR